MAFKDTGRRAGIRDQGNAVHYLIDAVPYEARPGVEIDESEVEELDVWDGGQAMGCAIERAFGDGNDLGG